MKAVVEHIRHAAAQRSIQAQITVHPVLNVLVRDPVERHALASVILQEPISRSGTDPRCHGLENLAGVSRFDESRSVNVTGPM